MAHSTENQNVIALRSAQGEWRSQPGRIQGDQQGSDLQVGAAPADGFITKWGESLRHFWTFGMDRIWSVAEELATALQHDTLLVGRGRPAPYGAKSLQEDVPVPLLALAGMQERIPRHSALLGLDEQGRAVWHDFACPEKHHMLVVGGPDAGKSIMLRSVLASLAIFNRQQAVQLAAISPIAPDLFQQQRQAATWAPLNYLPHMICDAAFRYSEIIELLAFLRREISYREEHGFAHPHVFLAVDRADVVLARGGRECAAALRRIAQKGPDVGLHLVLASRTLDRAQFGAQLLTDVPLRLIGRAEQEGDSRFLLDENEIDAQELLGQGDFYVRERSGARRLQGAHIDDYTLYRKLSELYRYQAILLAEPASQRVRLAQKPGAPAYAAAGKRRVVGAAGD